MKIQTLKGIIQKTLQNNEILSSGIFRREKAFKMSYRENSQWRGGNSSQPQQWQNWRQPKPHFDEEPQHQHPQQRKLGKKPASKASRDKQRSEKFRTAVGEKVMKDVVAKDIEDTLFLGFEDQKDAINEMMESFRRNPKLLPTSTRGSGMILQSVVKKIHLTTPRQPDCTIFEMYRVTLAQMELKLLKSEQQQVHPLYGYDRELFFTPHLTLTQQQNYLWDGN